jgi:hypothetical protein
MLRKHSKQYGTILLQNAKTYIVGQEEIDSCPVCSATHSLKRVVIASLEIQIASMDALDKAAKVLDVNTANDKILHPSKSTDTISTSIKYKISISRI